MALPGTYSMTKKIVYNSDEIAHHLTWLTFRRYFSRGPQQWRMLNKFYYEFYKPQSKWKPLDSGGLDRIQKSVKKDVELWIQHVRVLKTRFQTLSKMIEDRLPILAKQIGQGDQKRGYDIMFRIVMKGDSISFAKTLGPKLLPGAIGVFPEDYTDADDVFIRNILNNESILKDRIHKHKPFWFVDSGYTNFTLGAGKRYHRLVRNNIHQGSNENIFPADRLNQFNKFPKSWRKGGDKILVIEPSTHICQLYGIGITAWKRDVEDELRKHTKKKIVWREKTGTRKTRGNFSDDLIADKSIYCVVHYNSNAGTEAVWAGVPVITLGKHITESVSRTSLADINNLYRGPIGNWLCELSYSQFTFSELLINGLALKIWKKYHV
jgi:hypothetical protein